MISFRFYTKFDVSPFKCVVLFLLAIAVLVPFDVHAEDEVLTIQGTSIRGNQELPTVLYLVPWQAPSEKTLETVKTSLATKAELKPLERSEFKRMLKFHDHFLDLQTLSEASE